MRLQLRWAAVAVLTLAAGPALAQGTWSPGQPKSTWNSGPAPKAPKPFGMPDAAGPATPARPKIYGAPVAPTSPGFKPYEPYKTNPGTSVFGPDGKKKH